MTSTPFDFVAFEDKLAEYSPDIPLLGANRLGRRALWAGMLGTLVAISASRFLPSAVASTLMVVGFIVELLGLIIAVAIQLLEMLRQLRQRRRAFAQVLDAEYGPYLRLLSWLRSQDSADLYPRLAYVRRRRDMMQLRLGLLSGGIERLGVLPLVAALYFQIKDFVWPPQISSWAGIAAFTLIIFYGVGWWALITKLRLDLYEQLLSDALTDRKTVVKRA